MGFGFGFAFLAEGLVFLLWEAVEKPQRGRKATAPLHTPRAFFRSSWLWRCEVVDLCMYAGCWMCEVEPMYVDADGEARCCRLVERV